jgi:hypothetical protein
VEVTISRLPVTIFRCEECKQLFTIEEWRPDNSKKNDLPGCPWCAQARELSYERWMLDHEREAHGRTEDREDKIRDALYDRFGLLRSLETDTLCKKIRVLGGTHPDVDTCSRWHLLKEIARILKLSSDIHMGDLPQWVQRFQDDREKLRKALSFIAKGCVDPPVAEENRLALAMYTARMALEQDDDSER